ncbi:signal peptidase II [Chloroflexota bacterium]
MQPYLKKYLNAYVFLFLLAGSIIALDQFTKEMVRANIPLGSTWMPIDWLSPYARFVHWFNTGAAFGLFKNGSLVFSILAVIVMLLIIFYFPRVSSQEVIYRIAMAMQFAGAAGNFIDRLRFEGRVTDFISVGNFAVFNIADASITIGCVVLLIGSWYYDRTMKKDGKEEKLTHSLLSD